MFAYSFGWVGVMVEGGDLKVCRKYLTVNPLSVIYKWLMIDSWSFVFSWGFCPSVRWLGLSGRVPAVMYKVPDPCRC